MTVHIYSCALQPRRQRWAWHVASMRTEKNAYYYYLLQLSCHSVAVVLTPVQTKQIRLNVYKRNDTKNTVQTTRKTVNTSTHITKTPTHYKSHTLQNKLKQPQYKVHTK